MWLSIVARECAEGMEETPATRAGVGMNDYPYYWRVLTHYPERFEQRCRVLARNKSISKKRALDKGWYERTGKNIFTTNSCLVEFESDKHRTVTSRNYIRKVKR